MGRDGAAGLNAMHQAGARTIAQDERSSVVYGMPKAAVECGAVDRVLPLADIAREIAAQIGLGRPGSRGAGSGDDGGP
jgi:two-component system chemotaxis response regulator CheB